MADGHVWLAVALGYEARIIGPVMRAGWHNMPGPGQGRSWMPRWRPIPTIAYALAALGGWNIEIVRGAARSWRGMVYGASVDKGLALFDRAVQAGAGQCRGALPDRAVAGGLRRGRLSRTHRKRAGSRDPGHRRKPPTRNSSQTARQELLALMKRGDCDAFDARLAAFQGYP